jgi:acetylornithine deacetylase/succinyl-diaminopimelate desuccinylase-like protein
VSTTSRLREEVTELLQALLRVDTVNPPGNETLAAEVLRDYLAGQGIPSALVSRSPERANVVARLEGGDGPSLAFICHTDTVVADPVEWERDPWSGDLVDGEVWGRGALDMKDQVAASAVAFASLWRDGFRPEGDLVFAATADEEVGAGFGLEWLVSEHPELVRVDYAVNEGGGGRVRLGDSVYYVCGTAEKVSAPFRLRVRGRGGHASVPAIADNALVKAAPYIEALDSFRPRADDLIPEVSRFFEVTLGEVPAPEDALVRARSELGAAAVELVEPLLGPTVSPTQIEASHARNVIPAVCEVTVDCRLLPGQTPEGVEPLIREALGAGDWELEWIESTGGTRSALDTPLWSALDEFVSSVEPGARLLPICNAGFTDSHFLRQAFGTVAYGFFPMRVMDPELAARLEHAANERVPVDDLELGVDMLRHVALALL